MTQLFFLHTIYCMVYISRYTLHLMHRILCTQNSKMNTEHCALNHWNSLSGKRGLPVTFYWKICPILAKRKHNMHLRKPPTCMKEFFVGMDCMSKKYIVGSYTQWSHLRGQMNFTFLKIDNIPNAIILETWCLVEFKSHTA